MPIEYRFQYDQQIKDNDRGIYYCEIEISYQDKKTLIKDVIFSMSGQERTMKEILKGNYLKQIGFKEIKNIKQVIHLKVIVKKYLSDVLPKVYEQWKTS